jgi:hypothetical protein
MNAVIDASNRINELNEKYDYFIDAIKREDLYDFIDKA